MAPWGHSDLRRHQFHFLALSHRLIRDEAGKRLAKRDDARAIAKYRRDGLSPDQIRARVGL